LENATEKTKNAIAMKKEAESMTQEVDEELKKYKSTREVNHELIEKKMEELRNTTAMISEMESKALMDSQKKLDEINAKIEEAKMDSSYALTMSETVTNFRKLLENRPSYKP
jgi:DNA repair exonuclease SbcCD ATPase subunit